jgi:hypothetical protein
MNALSELHVYLRCILWNERSNIAQFYSLPPSLPPFLPSSLPPSVSLSPPLPFPTQSDGVISLADNNVLVCQGIFGV